MVHDMVIPNRGGGAPRTESVAKAFRDRGHNVFVFAPFGVDKKTAEKELGCNVIKMLHINRNNPKKVIKYGAYNPYLVLRTLSIVRKHKIDLIFVHDSICGFPALIASKAFKIPVVLDITDFIGEYIEPSRGRKHLFEFVKYIENKVIRESTKVITVSKAMAKILKEKGAKNISVVYDGVDFQEFYKCKPKCKPKGSFVFIYQGGMDPQDGLDILVPAAKKVVETFPNAKFLLVGDGKSLPKIKKEVKENDLKNNFTFTGWIPFKEVKQHISDSDVGLVILPDILSARIRVTLKTFEYWACEKPIIAAKLDALEEVVDEKTGLFYKADDSDDLAEKMIKICEDKNLYNKLKLCGIKKVKRFEWAWLGEKIVKESLGVLDE